MKSMAWHDIHHWTVKGCKIKNEIHKAFANSPWCPKTFVWTNIWHVSCSNRMMKVLKHSSIASMSPSVDMRMSTDMMHLRILTANRGGCGQCMQLIKAVKRLAMLHKLAFLTAWIPRCGSSYTSLYPGEHTCLDETSAEYPEDVAQWLC